MWAAIKNISTHIPYIFNFSSLPMIHLGISIPIEELIVTNLSFLDIKFYPDCQWGKRKRFDSKDAYVSLFNFYLALIERKFPQLAWI